MAALVFVGAIMTGCSNDDNDITGFQKPELPKDNVVTLTTTISRDDEAPTRGIDGSTGAKTFNPADNIAVVYEKTDNSFAKVVKQLGFGDLSNGNRCATITVTLTNPKPNGIVKYICPAEMVNNDGSINYNALYNQQNGVLYKIDSDLDLAKFEGNLVGTSELPSGTLRNQLVLCKFKVKDGNGTDITNTINKLTIKNGSDVYSVNRINNPDIWVAMKPVTSGTIEIYAAKGMELYRKAVTGQTLAASKIIPITVTAPKVEGAVSGLFSVNENHDLVYFSKGNLIAQWRTGEGWGNFNFAGYQSFFLKDMEGNIHLSNPSNQERIDLFGWSTIDSYNNYGINAAPAGSFTFSFKDWGTANIQNGGGANKWRTPSYDEFRYILQSRSASVVRGKSDARFFNLYLTDQNGLAGIVLLPDNYVLPEGISNNLTANHINQISQAVSLTYAELEKLEEAGAVFLPAAGYRNGTTVYTSSDGWPIGAYWTSTGVPNVDTNATSIWFGKESGTLYLNYEILKGRHHGMSVRLIGPGSANQ